MSAATPGVLDDTQGDPGLKAGREANKEGLFQSRLEVTLSKVDKSGMGVGRVVLFSRLLAFPGGFVGASPGPGSREYTDQPGLSEKLFSPGGATQQADLAASLPAEPRVRTHFKCRCSLCLPGSLTLRLTPIVPASGDAELKEEPVFSAITGAALSGPTSRLLLASLYFTPVCLLPSILHYRQRKFQTLPCVGKQSQANQSCRH